MIVMAILILLFVFIFISVFFYSLVSALNTAVANDNTAAAQRPDDNHQSRHSFGYGRSWRNATLQCVAQ